MRQTLADFLALPEAVQGAAQAGFVATVAQMKGAERDGA